MTQMDRPLEQAINRFERYMERYHMPDEFGYPWAHRLWDTGNIFCWIALVGLFGMYILGELFDITLTEIADMLTLPELSI